MKPLQLTLGVIAIAIGLPFVAAPVYYIFFQKTDKTIDDFKDRPLKTILPFYNLGIFMEGLSDLQNSKNGLKPSLIMLAIGLVLCIGGYLLLRV